MPDDPVCCGTCVFFEAGQRDMGLCHHGPGTVVVMPGPPGVAGQPQFITNTVLPPKRASDWCGQHPSFHAAAVPIDFSKIMPLDQRLAGESEGEA